MPRVPLIVLEIFLGFGVPLAWGVWQLISLRRERDRDRARQAVPGAGDGGVALREPD